MKANFGRANISARGLSAAAIEWNAVTRIVSLSLLLSRLLFISPRLNLSIVLHFRRGRTRRLILLKAQIHRKFTRTTSSRVGGRGSKGERESRGQMIPFPKRRAREFANASQSL